MSEWLDIQLGEVTEIQTGPFGSMLHQERLLLKLECR